MPEPLAYGEYLPAVYRFAWLMTGSVPLAAEILRLTVEQAERGDLSDVRDPRRVKRWLFARARSLCGRPPALPDAPEKSITSEADDSGRQLAALFAELPEAERSAAILFYLYLFNPNELAEALNVKTAELAELLTRGREILRKSEVSLQDAKARG